MQPLSEVMLANVVQKLWYAVPDGECVWRCVLISKEVSEKQKQTKKTPIICPRFVEEAKGSVNIYGGRGTVLITSY